jgi:hypothetical protein
VWPWISAFVFTLVVEAPFYRAAMSARRSPWAWALLPSVPTHPVVFFVFPALWPGGALSQLAAAEAFAVLAEAALLRKLGAAYPLRTALIANLTSAGLGLASRAAFGWP